MPRREDVIALVGRLHAAQADFYAGEPRPALLEMLAPDITWRVPGRNAIAGTYRGLEQVLGYFIRRGDLADH